MNDQNATKPMPLIPLIILLVGFGLLLFILLTSAPSPSPRINVQNASELREILHLNSGEDGYPPRQFALSPDAKQLLVTTGYRNEWWQLAGQTEQVMDLKQSGGYAPMVFFRDAQATAAFMDWRDNLSFQDMSGKTTLQRFNGLNGGADWDVTPDGKWLAATRDQLTLTLTNIETGEQRLSIHVPYSYHFRRTNATLSADGKMLATSLIHGEVLSFDIFLWDVATGTLIKKLGNFSAEEGSVSGLAFSHDGKRLAVGGSIIQNQRLTAYLQLWDIASSSVLATWTGIGSSLTVSQMMFTPDDRHFILEGSEKVWLWDVNQLIQTGTPLIYQKDNGSTLRDSATTLSPDGSLMATGATNGVITVYDVQSSLPLAVLKGHRGRINDIAFSEDGRLLVSSSDDHTVRFWSVGGYNPYPLIVHPQLESAAPAPIMTPTVAGNAQP